MCDIYVNIWKVYGTDKRKRKQVNQLQVFEIDQLNWSGVVVDPQEFKGVIRTS